MKTCCGNGTLQKVSHGVLATARPATIWEAPQFGLYCGVFADQSACALIRQAPKLDFAPFNPLFSLSAKLGFCQSGSVMSFCCSRS